MRVRNQPYTYNTKRDGHAVELLTTVQVTGVLLAAGSGSRMGMPKGLLRDSDGTPRIARVCNDLRSAGCTSVLAVLGAAAGQIRLLLPDFVHVVIAHDYEKGMGSSLRAGLRAASETPAPAAVIMLVDLPGVDSRAIVRVISRAHQIAEADSISTVLVRAVWNARPGHPVLLGRRHWSEAVETATGDRGARDLLQRPDAITVECSDLGTGEDLDSRQGLERFARLSGKGRNASGEHVQP